MSPSAYLRGGVQGIFFTLALSRPSGATRRAGRQRPVGVHLRNLQGAATHAAGIAGPAVSAGARHQPRLEGGGGGGGLRFPVVVKANVGGSGAGIVRFDRPDDLARAAAEGRINLGIDHTALVQEFIPARGGHITRVETLGGKYLYAIKVFTTGDTFNLCPADICQRSDGVELAAHRLPDRRPEERPEGRRLRAARSVIDAIELIAQRPASTSAASNT